MFWPFTQSLKSVSLAGMTDWHSHILPGVDDGVRNMDSALSILNEYERAGVKQVWLTPHIMEDMPNTTSLLISRFNELESAYSGSVQLRLASENMIDNLFYERLKTNDIIPIGDSGDMLLVETTVFNAPMDFEGTLRKILSKGYFPLLAHPERYSYMQSINDYKRLKQLGVRFQLNLLSLDGAYGNGVQKKAHDLLRLGMYDHCGSDLHSPIQIDRMMSLKVSSSTYKSLSKLNFNC